MKNIRKTLVALVVMLALVMIPATVTAVNPTVQLVQKGPDNWEITLDGCSVDVEYTESGPTFDFSLSGTVPVEEPTWYSLIYYADKLSGWGGDNPGAFLGKGESDASGNIAFTGSADIGFNLPHPDDTNYPDGAKLWLIPTDYYNELECRVISWPAISGSLPPETFLFETDLIFYQYEPAIGIPSQGTILPASISVDISPLNLNFGTIQQGATSSVWEITIANTGSVGIKASALVTDILGTLGTDCLELSSDGVVWVDSQIWSYTPILAGTSKIVYARLNVPPGYSLGTFTFTVFFLIQVAP